MDNVGYASPSGRSDGNITLPNIASNHGARMLGYGRRKRFQEFPGATGTTPIGKSEYATTRAPNHCVVSYDCIVCRASVLLLVTFKKDAIYGGHNNPDVPL